LKFCKAHKPWLLLLLLLLGRASWRLLPLLLPQRLGGSKCCAGCRRCGCGLSRGR
jgi:hypothetical protein